MISYNWAVQPAILHLRDRLKSAGFKVWIDVDNMCKYLFHGMFCLEVRGEIIRTVLCCTVYDSCAQS